MRLFQRGRGYVLAAALVLGGCGEADTPGPLGDRLQRLNGDLQLGASGEGVRTVNDYLTRFGYFPNEALALQYSGWRPVITEPPADPSMFDQRTADAVRALQANLGLTVTGVVDSATRAALQAPRCGVPEGLARLDASDKFALGGTTWPSSTISWKVTNNPSTVTLAQARTATAAAFAAWAAQTTLTFNQVTGTGSADILITFGPIDGPIGGMPNGPIAGQAAQPGNGGDITMDSAEAWSVSGAAGQLDLQTQVQHEIGHSLGLKHSSISTALLNPGPPFLKRTLDLDDKVAISSLYDTFGTLPGAGKDIAVGANGAIWLIGLNPLGDGFQVYKWNGSGWDASDGGAVRIAVSPTGIPWVVTASGGIFRRTTTNPFTAGAWQQIAGGASDIGIGANGDVWVIGQNPLGDGFQVYKWNGTTGSSPWTPNNGGAVRITVGPTGIPWVLTAGGQFFRHSNNSATTGSWELLPGTSTDLALNASNYTWSIGRVSSGQENLAVWDEQTVLGTAPAVKNWVQGKRMGVGGPNCSVAVGPNGRPFMTDNNGTIFTSVDGAP